ncbi:MAG: zinc ribbon domain-containing protein [Prevotella sp.]|nr:zinc ribbon domain-containing protein [Prevotella sp.]
MKNHKIPFLLLLLVLTVSLSGCYQSQRSHSLRNSLSRFGNHMTAVDSAFVDSTAWKRVADSLRFFHTHHYTENFNFVVTADSLTLIRQQPEEVLSMMPTDSFVVCRHDPLVVADIRIMPSDSVDTVWVNVARDQYTFGWVHESQLLSSVDPDDPISQFITVFSDTHVLLFLIVLSIIVAAYLLRMVSRKKSHIVHFNDIPSVWPTLLTLIVATAATLYASIQMFAPSLWQHFYFNPTLNPFSVPPVLMLFLLLVWAMLIVSLACVEVVRLALPSGEAMVYLMGLGGICAVDYIVFSITTLYYIGYLLLVAYFIFSLLTYYRHSHCRYACGNCGSPMHEKGRCQRCGAINV